MSLLNTFNFIRKHPLNKEHKTAAFGRFIKWQIGSRINPFPVLYPFVENSSLIVQRSMAGATGNIYCGLHEFSEMGFLLHMLRPEDLFLDIGANVGSYTILASGVVGARTLAFEPSPSTFRFLKRNVDVNGINTKVELYNMALGSSSGNLAFSSSLDTENHIVSGNEHVETITVPVEPLHKIMRGLVPVVMKIDVEGYETEVLKGMGPILEDSHLKAIIIELNGLGQRYGFNDEAIHENLLKLGFKPCQYDPLSRQLNILERYGSDNTIYIRNSSVVESRLRSSRSYRVLGQSL